MIHLENASKTYQTADGPVHALAEISMDVPPGEFVVVRGPSGSGKSTLLTLVGGLSRPSSGRVIVAGEDLRLLNASARARFRAERIGFVFQTFHLVPYLTVVENVAVAALPDSKGAVRRRASALLEEFGLGHRLNHRPAELSTGECQRVAIARAMFNRPKLILADEPTGNLDSDNAGTVLTLLADFHRLGGTVLLVTHQEFSPGDAQQRTVTLREGRIESATTSASVSRSCR
ncbi:MAG: ABC transporter ATP-binding protein [Pirellulales bacterium]|nr:ABC transporter ATP-binding protein [Pirellulales bacterium]